MLSDIKMPDDLSVTGQYCNLMILIYIFSNVQTDIERFPLSNPNSSKKSQSLAGLLILLR